MALLPLPVWPTSTIVSFLGADMATRRVRRARARARPRECASAPAADDQFCASAGLSQTHLWKCSAAEKKVGRGRC